METLPQKAQRLRRQMIEVSRRCHNGHLAPAFSALDIMLTLYERVMKVDRDGSAPLSTDHFVLSKGHACIGLYAVLAEEGFFTQEELMSFCQPGSHLGGHPDRNKVPGVDISTGSLGHGLPNAVGLATGYKIQNASARVFVLVGDGEMNEGSNWEAILMASQMKLGNLVCIVDNNHSIERAINMTDFSAKFRSFGWETVTAPGHDHDALTAALQTPHTAPLAVIAETVKGHGCRIMEENPLLWHHRSPNDEEYATILSDWGEK